MREKIRKPMTLKAEELAIKKLDNLRDLGHEPTAVDHTFSSFGGLWGTIKAMVFNTYANPAAHRNLKAAAKNPRSPLARLIELGLADDVKDKAGAA